MLPNVRPLAANKLHMTNLDGMSEFCDNPIGHDLSDPTAFRFLCYLKSDAHASVTRLQSGCRVKYVATIRHIVGIAALVNGVLSPLR